MGIIIILVNSMDSNFDLDKEIIIIIYVIYIIVTKIKGTGDGRLHIERN